MRRLQYHFYRNKELVLYLVAFVSHLVAAFLYNHFGFRTLFIYTTVVSFIYGIFILLFNTNFTRLFITFTFIEFIVYSLFVTVSTGSDFKTRMYIICIIPTMFFFIYRSKVQRKYYMILSLTVSVVILFILWWNFVRREALFSGFMMAVTLNKQLYMLNIFFSTLFSILFIFYLSILTKLEMSRSIKKTNMRFSQLEYIANHDQLTDLINRRCIHQFFVEAENKKLTEKKDYGICIFDIDNFKTVNDKFGHNAGDIALKTISSILKANITESEKLARWGGEEFLILFTKYSKSIPDKLDEFRKLIEEKEIPVPSGEGTIPLRITITAGVSSSRHLPSTREIIKDADDSLRFGKENGKNRVVVSGVF